MTSLSATLQRSRFVPQPHLVVTVDGVPLDRHLARLLGRPELEGLVSPLGGCLHDESEQEAVTRAALPEDGRSSISPILVCPDDCDLSCTLVVARIDRAGEWVSWTRMGLARADRSAGLPTVEEVDWFDGISPLCFGIEEYRRFLTRCGELAEPWWTEPRTR